MREKKRTFVVLAALLLSPPGMNAQNSVPAWYTNKELSYPASRYIAGVGEGVTRAEAEIAAVAAVSLFFNTKAEVRNELIREFNEAVSGDSTAFTKKTYIQERAVIRSDQELLGIRFASPWHDRRRGQWAALAYIDRQESAAMYNARISANMTAVRALEEDASNESEALYACALLYRSLCLAALTEELIQSAAVVDPRSAAVYVAPLAAVQRVRSAYRAIQNGLSFSIQVEGPDIQGRIGRKLGELLESAGYTASPAYGGYSLIVRLSVPEEHLEAGVFVRPGITLRIERRGGVLFSYNKNYPRSGYPTLEGAYNRAFAVIERDMEDTFIRRFTAMLGR
jgi:hypothetical protein